MSVGKENGRKSRFYVRQVGEPGKDLKKKTESSETSIISFFSSGKLIRECKKITSVIFLACALSMFEILLKCSIMYPLSFEKINEFSQSTASAWRNCVSQYLLG